MSSERTKQLMVRDPMEAADFYHKNIGSVSPDQRYELEHQLKTTTNTHYAASDGLGAYHSAIGQASASPTPADYSAPFVKPYDQKLIDSRAAFVKAPYKYDDEINSAAKAFNVNPAEIKLKIAMESMGDPNAVAPGVGHGDHATGLGQFTADTAKRYGVADRSDPVQSINGIARMLSATGGGVGGDMSKADRTYYGGNANAKGPNTDQYVENARVLRQAVFGGGAPAPLSAADLEGKEGDILKAADVAAEQRRPGDAAYRDQTRAEAHKNWAMDVQALKSRDYSNMTQVLDSVVKGGATSLSDLPVQAQQVYSSLTPQNREGVDRQFDHNIRAARGEYTQSDPKLVNKLTQTAAAPR